MTFEDFTIKAQDAINKAQQIASDYDQPVVNTAHLLKGLITVENSSVDFILHKAGAELDELKKDIDVLIWDSPKSTDVKKQTLSKTSNAALSKAKKYLRSFGDSYISTELILLGIFNGNDPTSETLKKHHLTEKNLIEAVKSLRKGLKINTPSADDQFNAIEKYAVNLNERAEKGELDPIIGRDEEVRRLMHILSRRQKNNPILIGEPGVGKTALVEGIAWRIVQGDVPDRLKTKRIYSLDLSSLVAGAKYKGEFEERLKALIKEVEDSNGEIFLFIDEIHQLVGAGPGGGSMNAANILKPALARGTIRTIGATTPNEFQKYFEKDKALVRRFQSVTISEPSVDETISILRGLQERYETYHQVSYLDDALIAAVQLSARYVSDRFLPDKAIDLMDEAGSRLRLELDSVPDEIDELARKVKQLEIEKAGLQAASNGNTAKETESLLASNKKKLAQLQSKWNEEKALVADIQEAREKIEEFELQANKAEREGDLERVGKIRYKSIKEQQEKLKKAEKKLHKIPADLRMTKEEVTAEDMAEIVARWTGIPVTKMLDSEREKLLKLEEEIGKSLIGQHQAVTAVSDAVRRNRSGLQAPGHPIGSFIFLGPTGVGKTQLAKALAEVLFNDEQAIIRIDMSEFQEGHQVSRLIGAPPGYVGYDEGGQLTEAVRRKPYSIVLLDEIEKAHTDVYNLLLQVLDDGRLTDNKGRVANFENTIVIMTSNLGASTILENFEDLAEMGDEHRDDILETTQTEVFDLLKEKMPPEFLNRIDEKIMFQPLTKAEISKIMHLMLKSTIKMLAKKEIQISLSKRAENFLVEKGYDPQFGARPMKRAIQKELINPLATKLIAGDFKAGDHIWAEEKKGAMDFSHKRK